MKRKSYQLLVMCIMLISALVLPMNVWASSGNSANVATKDEFIAAINDDNITIINVTSDIDLSRAGVLDASGCVIDLGGHKISAGNFSLIFEGSHFTIKNGTFDAKGGSYALFIGDEGTTDQVIVENITAIGGINVYNATNVKLRDVDVTGNGYYAIWCDENGHVTVESGTFKTNGVAVVGLTTENSELFIQGGSFETAGKPLVLKNGNKWGKPVISGETFDVEVDEEYCSDGFDPVDNGNGQYGVCNHEHIKIVHKKAATCLETGYTGDQYCQNCNKLIQLGKEIAKTDHTPSAWKYNQDKHWKECIVDGCGVIILGTENKHQDTDQNNQCDICGYKMKKVSTSNNQKPQIDDDYSTSVQGDEINDNHVNTSDNQNYVVYGVLLLTSIFGLVVLNKRKKVN